MKKIIATILSFVMVLGTVVIGVPEEGLKLDFGLTAFAASEVASGKCGDNLTWVLDSDGKLTISGSGYMWGGTPWDSNLSEIKTVEIMGATSIDSYAFSNCTSLTSVTIPDSVTSIGWSAFSSCTSLTSVTIPDSVTSISDSAFWNCESLTSVTIPDSVTYIGDSAFSDCTSLTSVTIPDSVTSIGKSAFRECDSLTSITIPDSVTSIGEWVLSGCDSLTSVTIGDGVTSIGYSAFKDCTSLESVTIPDSVTAISDYTFWNCESLASVTIPDSVTSIGDYAFWNCNSLTSVTIPDSVTSIGEMAFDNCRSLTSVTIPDGVTSIGDSAFWGCDSLASVVIGDSVTSIGGSVFCLCTSLNSVTIPYSVTSIGDYAFAGCEKLTDVYYTGTEAQWKAITIGLSNDPLLNATMHYNYVMPETSQGTIKISENCQKTVMAGNQLVVWGEVVATAGALEAVCNSMKWTSSNNEVISLAKNEFVLPSDNLQDDTIFIARFNTHSAGKATLTCELSSGAVASVDVEVLTQEYKIRIVGSTGFNVEKDRKISISAALIEHDEDGNEIISEADGDLKFEVSNNAVISLENTGTRENITHLEVTGLSEGNSILNVTDPVTGAAASVMITTFAKPLGYRINELRPYTYKTDFLWFTIEEEAYIYNVNGIYAEKILYSKEKSGDYRVLMDLYNTNASHAAVDIYDADGNWIESALVEKFDTTISSLSETFDAAGNLIVETMLGETFTYKQSSYSKHTRVDITVPKDGYFVINTGVESSGSVLLYNLFDLYINCAKMSVNVAMPQVEIAETLSKIKFDPVIIAKLVSADAVKAVIEETSQDIAVSKVLDRSISLMEIVETVIGEDFGDFVLKSIKEVSDLSANMLQSAIEVLGGSAGAWLGFLFTWADMMDISAQIFMLGATYEDYGIYINMPIESNPTTVTMNGISVTNTVSPFDSKIVLRVESKWKGAEYDNAVNRFSNLAETRVYDISLTDGETIIQPNGKVEVSVPVPEGYRADECSVYRLESDGTYTDMCATVSDSKLVFATDHFSVYVVTAGELTRLPGDVNSDGEVNLLDSTVLRRHLAGWDITINASNADVNDDGKVDMKDSTVLRRYLAGWPGVALK